MKLHVFLFLLGLSVAPAQVTYVDADTSNTAAYDPVAYPGTDWFTATTSSTDNLWALRTFANGGTIFESHGQSGSEDAPGLVLTLSGLNPGETYEISAYFWSAANANWCKQK